METISLYECPCFTNKKEQHHPNYDFPNLVVRLCKRCHTVEHIRLRSNNLYASSAKALIEFALHDKKHKMPTTLEAQEIIKLKSRYGTNKQVAEVLGVTERYVQGLLAEEYAPGKSLQKLIKIFVKRIEEDE